jgi:hypothetical protein
VHPVLRRVRFTPSDRAKIVTLADVAVLPARRHPWPD